MEMYGYCLCNKGIIIIIIVIIIIIIIIITFMHINHSSSALSQSSYINLP